eukprot:765976-Hanusia_phi.AAC.9
MRGDAGNAVERTIEHHLQQIQMLLQVKDVVEPHQRAEVFDVLRDSGQISSRRLPPAGCIPVKGVPTSRSFIPIVRDVHAGQGGACELGEGLERIILHKEILNPRNPHAVATLRGSRASRPGR